MRPLYVALLLLNTTCVHAREYVGMGPPPKGKQIGVIVDPRAPAKHIPAVLEAINYWNNECNAFLFVYARVQGQNAHLHSLVFVGFNEIPGGLLGRAMDYRPDLHVVEVNHELLETPHDVANVLRHELGHVLHGPKHFPRDALMKETLPTALKWFLPAQFATVKAVCGRP